MAIAQTVTLIPLDRVAHHLQIDPVHFNSVEPQIRPLRNACDDIWFQHDWQNVGRLSRESLATALKQAEEAVAHYLGYYPAPRWIKAEEHILTKPPRPELYHQASLNVRGQSKSFNTNFGYVVYGGQKARSLIQAGAAIVYTDTDSDTWFETATVTVATAITDIEEIAIFYPGKSGADRYEIRPITVAVAGGIATITFKREQAVLESELEKLNEGLEDTSIRAVSGEDNSNFLTTVDVYRVYNDPSAQLIFYTEEGCIACAGGTCAVCGADTETGCTWVRNSKLGIVAYARADWNTTNQAFVSAEFANGREPDKVRYWYRAGWRDWDQAMPHRTMDPVWERLIVFYALSLLDTEICGCENTKRIITHQRQDLARPTERGAFAISPKDLDNPLGTTRAALRLWKQIVSPNTRLVQAR